MRASAEGKPVHLRKLQALAQTLSFPVPAYSGPAQGYAQYDAWQPTVAHDSHLAEKVYSRWCREVPLELARPCGRAPALLTSGSYYRRC